MRFPLAWVVFRIPKAASQFGINILSSWAQEGLCFSLLLSPTHALSCKSTVLPHNRCDCFPLRCHGNAHCHLGVGEVATETNEWPIRLSRKVFSWYTAHCQLWRPDGIKGGVGGPWWWAKCWRPSQLNWGTMTEGHFVLTWICWLTDYWSAWGGRQSKWPVGEHRTLSAWTVSGFTTHERHQLFSVPKVTEPSTTTVPAFFLHSWIPMEKSHCRISQSQEAWW